VRTLKGFLSLILSSALFVPHTILPLFAVLTVTIQLAPQLLMKNTLLAKLTHLLIG
jgi:hypothetical protein